MSSFEQHISPDTLNITESARKKMVNLLSDSNEKPAAVRIFVSGGGCGGMNYGMTFADRINEKDSRIFDDSGFSLVVDPVALAYLQGAEIDFQDDGISATFVFNNVFQSVGGSGACSGCGGAR